MPLPPEKDKKYLELTRRRKTGDKDPRLATDKDREREETRYLRLTRRYFRLPPLLDADSRF